MNTLGIGEKSTIKYAFNKGGYVLDFSNYSFDKFTMESVGVSIQNKYMLSSVESGDSSIVKFK